MSITRTSVKNPMVVTVVVIVLFLLGALSAARIPIQFLPNIDQPTVGIWTGWRGASPKEVESEITEAIERELRGIDSLKSMQSLSNVGGSWVQLEFEFGSDMLKARFDIMSRLQRIRSLPANADRPQIDGGGVVDPGKILIVLFAQRLEGSSKSQQDLEDFVRDRLTPELQSIPGISSIQVNTNDGEEIIRILFNPFKAAQLGISIDDMTRTINRSNNVTGGLIEVGRRNYTVRFEGRFNATDFSNTILAWKNGSPIRLKDIAEVNVVKDKSIGIMIQNGNPAIGLQLIREPGTNTLKVLKALDLKLEELNAGAMAQFGFRVEKSFDPSIFIKNAIRFLIGSLILGVFLAIIILRLFLKSTPKSLIIAVAIPLCVTGVVIALHITGRSINVISLAGLAFTTGMVLDAAIITVNNIERFDRKGLPPVDAAAKGVSEVFGALFASTLTTIAIFTPILFFQDIEAQLFADLAITITIGACISFIVAITILPTLYVLLRRFKSFTEETAIDGVAKISIFKKLANYIISVTDSRKAQISWVLGLTTIPILVSALLFPSLDYLPPIKRATIDGFIAFPSGAGNETIRTEFADVIADRLEPHLKGEKEPAVLNYFLLTGTWGGSIGIRPKNQNDIKALEKLVNQEILSGFPDTRAFAREGELFSSFGGAGQLSIELQSSNYEDLVTAAPEAIQIISQSLPGSRVWPNPDFQVVRPEIKIIPNDRRLSELGMSRADLANTVRVIGDGIWLGEFFNEDRQTDIYLEADVRDTPEALLKTPFLTPTGVTSHLGEIAIFERTVGPQQILHKDARRTVSLGINISDNTPLGDIIEVLKSDVEAKLYNILPEGSTIQYSGEIDGLDRAIKSLGGNFILAVILLFLIMTALFKSIIDAMFAIITLPMAVVGSVIALKIQNFNTPTPLDLLGMMGFIVILGIVVNNAILLIEQTKEAEASGLNRHAAVREALLLRTKPILMTAATTLAGLLPLVVSPGYGAQMYRGFATVIVGGILVSTIFTLLLLPSLLRLFSKAPSYAKTQDKVSTT